MTRAQMRFLVLLTSTSRTTTFVTFWTFAHLYGAPFKYLEISDVLYGWPTTITLTCLKSVARFDVADGETLWSQSKNLCDRHFVFFFFFLINFFFCNILLMGINLYGKNVVGHFSSRNHGPNLNEFLREKKILV